MSRGASRAGSRIPPLEGKKKNRRLANEAPILKNIRQRPTLPRGFPRSTIGSGGLNFRVRDGNGCDPSDIATGNFYAPGRWQFRTRRGAYEGEESSSC